MGRAIFRRRCCWSIAQVGCEFKGLLLSPLKFMFIAALFGQQADFDRFAVCPNRHREVLPESFARHG
jgi:hypothetical protein